MYDEETVLRAIELMRSTAHTVAVKDLAGARQRGHTAIANDMEVTGRRINELSAYDILALATGEKQRNDNEAAAFEEEGRRLGFVVVRNEDGELFHPISKRAWQIWRAAVRWARANP